MTPFQRLGEWLQKEKDLGVAQPECAVLATTADQHIPHCRVVAIRRIEADSLIFFTQQQSRKVEELHQSPLACMNFWLSLQQRQIILEGSAYPLTSDENLHFWQNLGRERQLRFCARAASAGQVIQDLQQLETKRQGLEKKFSKGPIPLSKHYCGFRFIPEKIIFYTVGTLSFSEVIHYSKNGDSWQGTLISP